MQDCVRKAWWEWSAVIELVADEGCPTLPPPKVFKPKFNLAKLTDYKDSAPASYWGRFPTNKEFPGVSKINPDQLRALAAKYGVTGENLDICLVDLEYGADIGCRGVAREPSFSTNAPSAYEFGPQVSDAIADWVAKGFAAGPFKREEIPDNVTINGIMVKEKPNGSVRIILNLSSPRDRGVNSGINKDEFPAIMSSTPKWVRSLNLVGPGGYMCKLDWASAYKHISVRLADLPLQWFKWLDRYFLETSLIFGGVSSVGIYDRHAKIVLELVLAASGFPRAQVCQHLDDVPAVGLLGDITTFDDTYIQIAEQLGIELAPRDDPEKAFAPSKRGIVFGVCYDLDTWTWAVPAERLARLLNTLHSLLDKESLTGAEVESVAGKLIHVRPLVPGGKFHVDELLKAVSRVRKADPVKIEVEMTPLLRSQLRFWSIVLPACSGRVSIPNLDMGSPAWSIDFFSDAAGGCVTSAGHGLGAVGPDWWVYTPWPRLINDLRQKDPMGKSWGQKLTLLELLGPLFVVSAGAAICRGQDVRVWVDNIGAIDVYRKGYCPKCPITSSVARALAVVAAGIGCRLYVVKIRRCSTPGAIMADALSKAAFRHFLAQWVGPLPDAGKVPRALLRWLLHPRLDPGLGNAILDEILP